MNREPTKEEADAFYNMKDDEKIARAIVAACDSAYKLGRDDGFERGKSVGKSVLNHWAFLPVIVSTILITATFVGTLSIGLFFAGVNQ